jgi:hypothetical protein
VDAEGPVVVGVKALGVVLSGVHVVAASVKYAVVVG